MFTFQLQIILEGKHCWCPIAVMGVVDHLGISLINLSYEVDFSQLIKHYIYKIRPLLVFCFFSSCEFHNPLCHNHYSDSHYSHQCRPCQLLTLHMSLSKARQCSGAVVSSIILKGEIISALFLATDYGGMMANSLTLCSQKSYPKQIFLLKCLEILFLCN